MLKEQLLEEAKTIDASVELDAIFESVELSEDVKTNFKTVFDASVKKHAIELAESHIKDIAEKADTLVESTVDERVQAVETKLVESIDKFLDHLSKEWLQENKVAIDRGIKAELFESMLSGLKDVFVEHNVVVPEESVDVVAEMEEELAEAKDTVSSLFNQLTESQKEVAGIKREVALKEATLDLTESQKEKVQGLVEGLEYSEQFQGKVQAIVEMVQAAKPKEETAITESLNKNDDPAGLNFVVEKVEETATPAPAQTQMNAYLKAAKLG